MRSLAVHALLWGSIMQIVPMLAHARGRTNPMFYGNFQGISPVRARNGASFGDSALSFSLNGGGLTFGLGVDRSGREWKLRYGSEWFMKTDDGVRDNCVFVAQALRAADFAYLICFDLDRQGRATGAVMAKPNDSLVTRYVKVRETDKRRATRETLRSMWAELHRPASLLGINEAGEILRGPAPASEKIDLLRRFKVEFRNFDEEALAHFEPLVGYALQNSDSAVQRAALEVFATTPTPTNVAFVLRLARAPQLADVNVETLIQTLGWFLHQINEREAMRDTIASTFGSDDIDYVFKKTGGTVAAKDMRALGDLLTLDRRRSRAWTEDQRTALRTLLREFASLSPSADERKVARRVLRAWEPSVTCAESLVNIRATAESSQP